MDINLIASSTSNKMLVRIVIVVEILSVGTGTIINVVVVVVDMTTMARHVGGVEAEVAVVVLLLLQKVVVGSLTKHVDIKLRKRIAMVIIIIPRKNLRGMNGVDDNHIVAARH